MLTIKNIKASDEIICRYVFDNFTQLFPSSKLENYNVEISLEQGSSPICCPKRLNPDFDQDFIIYLTFKEKHWAQLIYQLVHELSHAIMNCYPDNHHFKWISECLCNAISFCFLISYETIETNGFLYTTYATSYFESIPVEIKTNSLAEIKSFINENLHLLRIYPCNEDSKTNDRPRNNVISKYWCDLILGNTLGLEAIKHFSNPRVYNSEELHSFFNNWYNVCSNESQKQFVSSIRESVGLEILA